MADSKPGRAGPAAAYQLGPFASSTSTSPPTPAFRADIFGQVSSPTSAQIYGASPTAERHPGDRSSAAAPSLSTSASDPASFAMDTRPAPAVVIRRLPRNISTDAIRSMLIFAGDLIDTEFIRSPYPEDQGFATAVARFQTSAGALEAQQKLHGKPNTTKEATMIVEVHTGSAVGAFERRNTIDIPPSSRTQTSSASSGTSIGAPPSRSRFGSAFQSSDKLSPPLSSPGNGDFPMPENSAHFKNLFSPQSPLANGIDGQQRVSGKSMINDDAVDDETGELLKDPVAYAKSGQQPMVRRPTNPQIPVSRFGSLSLNTNGAGSAMSNGLTSPRGVAAVQSAMSSLSPTSTTTSNHSTNNMNHHNSNNNSNSNSSMPGMTSNSGYPYPRPQYPPVNPADQNPPCNTLYVGNLPIDTSEDELKALFSKQRGYKRLCFRTKQNGPMCFVEFEDVSFATKALHELYGHPLHNSVKGGIRLSFSKNPLGVRSGQTNGMGASAVMSPQAMSPTYGMMSGASFSSVSGPPPGLATPPGLINGGSPYRSPPPVNGMDGMFSAPFAMPPQGFVHQLSMRPYSAGMPPNMGSGPFGRDSRAAYDNSTLGR